jgi:hypothetical protein
MLSAVLLYVIMLNITNNPFMLSLMGVVMLSVVMLSVVMLCVVMLSVVMLSVVMMSVVMLNVVGPTEPFVVLIYLRILNSF